MRVPWRFRLLCVAVALSVCNATPLPLNADELRLDAAALAHQGTLRDVQLCADGNAIELESGELIEDDGPAAGYSYQPNEERLADGIAVKKEILIDDPRARRAFLLIGPGGELKASINGASQLFGNAKKTGGYWQQYAIDPAALKAGSNEIVLSGNGKLWIARDDEFAAGSRSRSTHPNRSAKSTDGGKTWDTERLGTGNDIDGEYYVRLFLDRYRAEGAISLPVIDVANLAGAAIAPAAESVGPIEIAVEQTAGAAGKVELRVRTGSTWVPAEKTWSAWQAFSEPKFTLAEPAGRFLQIEPVLTTSDPLTSPKLQAIHVAASPKLTADWRGKLRVVEAQNPPIVRSSIPFEYEPLDQPRLKELRERYGLDEVVAGAKTELELISRLAAWSAKRWERGHLSEIYPDWDALQILQPHADGSCVGGFCQQYNLVFLQACESFGLIGRAVSIGPGDRPAAEGGLAIRGGHEVVEIWSNEFGKWIYVDGNTAWYFLDAKSREPLSLLELRDRQLATVAGDKPSPVELVRLAESKYEWKGLASWPPFAELRLIPRSNFLEHAAPLPLNQGMRGWFWTGHNVWTDERTPASLLYGNRVTSRSNWNWTLNQAQFTLQASETPGEILIELDTQTPGFETFLASIDDGPATATPAVLRWKLKPGSNRIEVRTRNSAGRLGPASCIAVEFRP